MKKISLFTIIACVSITLSAQNNTPDPSKKYTQNMPGSKVSFSMVPIPGGTFMMGSPASDSRKQDDETPQKKVDISPFWMGATEVTHDEFNVFFHDAALSNKNDEVDVDAITRPTFPYIDLTLGMGKEGGYPVNSLKPYSAMMYCKWLYDKTGVFYRLPTEAEWEYACRAGSTTTYPFGNEEAALRDHAWFKRNSKEAYHKVAQKKPNAWGLYDMLGNVSEWVIDQYKADYYNTLEDGVKDPVNMPATKHPIALRGGSYVDDAKELRSANRLQSQLIWNRRDPQVPKSKWWNADASFTGFRIVRPVNQPSKEEAIAFYNTYLGL